MSVFSGNTEQLKTVLARLREEGIYLPADCGGRGVCGRCRVKFLSAAPEPTAADRARLSGAELSEGIRLSCKASVRGAFTVEYEEEGAERIAAEAVPVSAGEDIAASAAAGERGARPIAVDLGTTTIAAALIDAETKAVLRTETATNRQRAYGADVISRIKAANEGNGADLKRLVNEDVQSLVRALGGEEDTPVFVSGNTAMQHLFRGLSCAGLGVAPYTPVTVAAASEGAIHYLPGISAFVGADIVSGIVAAGIDTSDKLTLFLDIGTNGEIAIGNRDRLLVTSTAAGPALEGGNLSCGVAGVAGAITSVRLVNGRALLGTIGQRPAIGVCGTGVIETVYELLAAGILDANGLLKEPYFTDGFPLAKDVIFTQGDVREVQLAKAAIRAGLDTVIDAYGAAYADIGRLVIAGGFGKKLDLKKAAGIGLLPETLLPRAEALGNTSLQGAVLYAAEPIERERFAKVSAMAEEVLLANDPAFQERYLSAMNFRLDK